MHISCMNVDTTFTKYLYWTPSEGQFVPDPPVPFSKDTSPPEWGTTLLTSLDLDRLCEAPSPRPVVF